MDRIEAIVDYVSREKSLGDRENVADEVVEHVEETLLVMRHLTDSLMGKGDLHVESLCSMGAK